MMRFLALSYNVQGDWYPSDLRKRAKVDEYLDMHHSSLRAGLGQVVFKSMFAPVMEGRKYEDHELEEPKKMLRKALDQIEMRLTKHKYLAGDFMSIADIAAAHELDQGRFVALDLSKWPNTKAWLYHMIDEQPNMMKYAKVMRAFAAKAKPRVAKL